MIYVRLLGGLGNQLFQYAAARAIALRNGSSVGLDLRSLPPPPHHLSYALHHFGVQADIEPPCLPPERAQPLRYMIWRVGVGSPRFLRERGLHVNLRVLRAPDDTYLHGYFQSESYFADHLRELRHELRIVTPPDPRNSEWLDRIRRDPHSVSVHIRRGDYVALDKASNTHGTCDAAYYSRAIAHLRAVTGGYLRAYVFSDDPSWVQANLRLDAEMEVVGHNGPTAHYEDLRLMSACRHHIIANSTFSWWGAWLDDRHDKAVIAPQRWFASGSLVNPDIVPGGWVRL